jgi:hypothetical protein
MLDVFNMPLRKKKPLSLCGYFSPELRHTPKSDQLPQGQATPVTGIDQVINKIAHSDQLSKKSILKKAPTSHRHRFDFFNLGCRLICKPKSDNRPEAPPSTTMAKDKAGGEDGGTRKVARPKVTFDVIYEEDEDSERVRAPRRRETHPNIRELNRRQAISPSARIVLLSLGLLVFGSHCEVLRNQRRCKKVLGIGMDNPGFGCWRYL